MRPARAFIAFLILFLLFIQQGAVLHELDHAFAQVRHSQQDDQTPADQPDVCDLCAAYVSGGAAIPPAVLDFQALAPGKPVATGYACGRVVDRQPAPYRSRAPPLVFV